MLDTLLNTGLEARLFGIAAFFVDGAEVSPPTRKAVALLSLLLLGGEQSREALAGLLWGGNPERARRNLRQELYRLSGTPFGARLEQHRDALRLRPPFSSDVERFRAAVRGGRLAEARMVAPRPLLESPGIPAANGFRLWLERERAALEAERREASVGYAAALARDGLWREALLMYQACLEGDELQEHLHREVMRLQARLGDRGAALAQFEHLRRLLRRQVGLEPLPETRALAERIRAGDEREASPPELTKHPVQRQVAVQQQGTVPQRVALPPLLGRAALLPDLGSAAHLSLLLGEPGIGKTRLALEVAGPDALLLRGQEALTGVGLHPVASVLRQASPGLAGLAPEWRLELARLLPELPEAPAVPDTDGAPEGRWRFLHGLARALLHLVDSQPEAAAAPEAVGAVILDDLHWFDASSFEVLAQLKPLLRARGLRLIATAREPELFDNPAAGRWLNDLDRAGRLKRLSLARLEAPDLGRLAAWVLGTEVSGALTAQLQRATAGNPLYALETLRGLRESGAPESLIAPASPLAALSARVDRLGASARRALEVLCLAAPGTRLEVIASASALGDWEALEALERAEAAALIVGGEAGYRFAHDLTRTALESAMGGLRLRLLHRRLAEGLETRTPDGYGENAQVALHWEGAGLPGRAVNWRLLAAEEATRVFAYRESLEQYAAALRAGAGPAQTLRVRRARLRLHEYLDDRRAWGEELNALEPLMDPVELQLERARHGFALSRFSEALALCEAVLEASHQGSPAPGIVQRATVQAARCQLRLGRTEEVQERLRPLLCGLERQTPAFQAEVHELLTAAALHRDDRSAAGHHNEAALRAARAAKNELIEITALNNRARLAERRADPRASDLFAAAYERALERRIVPLQRTILLGWSAALINTGRYPEAAEKLETGLALSLEPQDPRLRARFLANLAGVHQHRGDLGAALAAEQEALEIFDAIGEAFDAAHERLNQAEFLMGCGDTGAARAALERAALSIERGGFSGLRAWLELLRVWLALTEGRVPPLGPLEAHLGAGGIIHDLTRRYGLCILAEARLMAGDAVEALELTAGIDDPASLRAMALGVRLRALVALRRQSAAGLEEALELLASPTVASGVKLGLYAAVSGVLAAQGATERGDALRLEARRFLDRLADSLQDGSLRARFLAHWRQRLSRPAALVPVRRGPAERRDFRNATSRKR